MSACFSRHRVICAVVSDARDNRFPPLCCAQELLKCGANPLLADKYGNTVLHIASRRGNADILSRALNSKVVQRSDPVTYDVLNYKGE